MITLKDNIEFLNNYNLWRRDDIADRINTMPSPAEIGLHLDYAIESLKMLEHMIKDVATGELVRRGWLINPDEEKLFDSLANNGEAL